MEEKLAELQHDIWSGWMHYLFSKGTQNEHSLVGSNPTLPANFKPLNSAS